MTRMSNSAIDYNYKMITLARESRGLSQTELAKHSGLSQGKISKVESGILTLSSDELQRVAECLRYPLHFFQRNHRTYGVGLGEFYHRKKQSVSQKQLNKVYARIEIRRMELIELLKSVDLGKSNFFHMDPDQVDGRVEEIARITRATWRVPRGPVDNVIETIEEAGGIVIPFDYEGLSIDAISIWVPELPPLFFVNMERPMDRIRFTLCHEVGHVIMHDSAAPGADVDIEDQADRFAAEFLMPGDEIGPSLSDLSLKRLPSLKLRWKVSMSSIIMTARNLERISPSKARYLWTQLSSAGYKVREPESLEPPREHPTLLNEIIRVHTDELHYSLSDLSFAVGLSENECSSLYFHKRNHLRLIE
ncbi:MAG: XRE family transcriptional regulator [Alicyclobacillus sp.]|nr:XRE family transcriptional regulator [Alicyclobacillus sp.]